MITNKLTYIAALTAGFMAAPALAGGPEIIAPDYFSGFFVGGTGAFHMAGFNGSSTATVLQDMIITGQNEVVSITHTLFSVGTLAHDNINGNAFDGYYGVQGGVGKVFNHRWYAGVVGFGEWGDQSTQTDISNSNFGTSTRITINGVQSSFLPTAGSHASSSTVKLSNDYGVAFKPGFLLSPTTLAYGKIGAIWANLKVSTDFSANSQVNIISDGPFLYNATGQISGSSETEQTKVALLLGIGAEQFIYRDFVSINVEYDYANYGSVTTSAPLTGQGTGSLNVGGGQSLPINGPLSGAVAQATANVKVSTLLAGLNFYFGSQWF